MVASVLLTAIGVGAMVFAFLGNANPYVTIPEAKSATGKGLNVAGDIVRGTMKTDAAEGVVRFLIRDASNQTLQVEYKGMPPANMGSAMKVVAIGEMKDGTLLSDRLLIKCPTKYAAEKEAS